VAIWSVVIFLVTAIVFAAIYTHGVY